MTPTAVVRCKFCSWTTVPHCMDESGQRVTNKECRWVKCRRCGAFGDPLKDRWAKPRETTA